MCIYGCNNIFNQNIPTIEYSKRNEWIQKLLYNPTCKAPCWENITPGITTIDEGDIILSNLSGIEPISIIGFQNKLKINNEFEWEFINTSDRGRIVGDKNHEKIFFIYLDINKDQLITLDEAISVFGNPTNILVTPWGNSEVDKFNIHILYTYSGIEFGIEKIKGNREINITKGLPIYCIKFFSEGHNNFLEAYNNLQNISPNSFLDWKGYGEYIFH